jgi:predicted DsbA family dithiol-disulfide isomerase
MIGKEPVLAGELVDAGQASFDKLSRERAQHANVLQLRYEQAYHDLLAAQLDKRLDQRALELEAAARHVKSEVILAEIKVPIVTDAEVQALYQASKDRIGQSFDAVAGPIREYLTSQHNEQASRAFYDELRRRHGIKSLLGPYRISLAATGPVRGKSTASVTIVEFGDFQCPYCRQAESVLADLLRKYPDDVRLVFRQLPLTDLHPNAMVAAEAAVCAEQQGKFWEMHDAMYGDQDSLTAPQLTATAEHLGVDKDRFSECLKDEGQTRTELGADMEAAANIGAATTPYFLIDGRPVIGLMPEADFEKIVKEELSQPRRADRS